MLNEDASPKRNKKYKRAVLAVFASLFLVMAGVVTIFVINRYNSIPTGTVTGRNFNCGSVTRVLVNNLSGHNQNIIDKKAVKEITKLITSPKLEAVNADAMINVTSDYIKISCYSGNNLNAEIMVYDNYTCSFDGRFYIVVSGNFDYAKLKGYLK